MLLPSLVADAILASPDDVAPRLRFASELRARGEAEKARFIEVQCALAIDDSEAPEARERRREQAMLWASHRDAWCAELGISPPEATLDRGVVTGLCCTIEQLSELAPSVLPHSAIDSLTLLVHPICSLKTLADCEHLARIRHLTLVAEEHRDGRTSYRERYSVEHVIANLLRFPAWRSLQTLTIDEQAQKPAEFIDRIALLGSLRALTMTHGTISDEDARQLASFSWMPQLEVLDLRNTELSSDALLTLVTANRGALRSLAVGGNPLDLDALERALGALRLDNLGLGRSGLDAASLTRLLRLPGLAHLRRLELSDNTLDADVLSAIASLTAVHHLDLRSCELRGEVLAGWTASETHLPWRSLDLAHNVLGEAGMARLASLSLPELTTLSLCDTGLDDAAASVLSTTSLPSLHELDVSGNPIDLAGFESIAARAIWPALRVMYVGERGTSAEALGGLLRWPGLASLRRLSLAAQQIDEALANALASCDGLGAIEELSLDVSHLDDAGAPLLANASNLGSLRSIDLRLAYPRLTFLDALRLRPGLLHLQASESLSEGHYKTDSFALARDGLGDAPIDLCFGSQTLSDDDIEALFRCKNLSTLVSLVLGWHGFGERGALALARATHLRRLRELCLASNPIGSHALEALLQSAVGSRLHCLNLRDCGLNDDAARAIASAPGGEHLENLYLCENPMTAAGLSELVSSSRLRNLEILHLASIPMGTAGAIQVFERACLPGLKVLNLDSTGLDDEALRVLAGNPDLAALEYLRIPNNPIVGPGIEALVQGGHFAGLTHLNLRHCQLDDSAAVAIANSPHLAGLRFLALSDNHITDQGAIALAKSKTLGELETLSLEGNPIRDQGRKALKRRGFSSEL